uniref:Uncharacterized protein n=1 Tax=Megaselia scalaris TaxID=36166 RepID=T1GKY1_MEGSC
KKLELLENTLDPLRNSVNHPHHNRKRTVSSSSKDNHLSSLVEQSDDESDSHGSESSNEQNRNKRDYLTNPYWIEDPELRKGEVDYLSNAEIQFWKDLIDKYLYPIDQDKDEQDRIAKDLKELRNSSVFFFFM